MACTHIRSPIGDMIVCNRTRRRRCGVHACREWSVVLCDYKLTGPKAGKTCDKPLCAKHRVQKLVSKDGETVDYCPSHEKLDQEQKNGPLFAHGKDR